MQTRQFHRLLDSTWTWGSVSLRSASLPVVVHVADQHGVESIKVPAEDGELVQDEQLGLLGVPSTVGLQQLLLGHHLHRLLLQFLQRRQEVAPEQICPGFADDGLHVHWTVEMIDSSLAADSSPLHYSGSPAILFIQEASSMPRLLLRILRMLPRMTLRCSEVTVVQQTLPPPAAWFSGPFSHQ